MPNNGPKIYQDCIHFKVLSNNLILYLPTYLFELRYHAKLPPNIIRDRQINSPSKRVDDVPLINNHIKPSQYSQRVMADGKFVVSTSYTRNFVASVLHFIQTTQNLRHSTRNSPLFTIYQKWDAPQRELGKASWKRKPSTRFFNLNFTVQIIGVWSLNSSPFVRSRSVRSFKPLDGTNCYSKRHHRLYPTSDRDTCILSRYRWLKYRWCSGQV